MRPKRPSIRSAVVAVTAAALAALLATPVSAFEILNQTGHPGGYRIFDDGARAGVVCRFADETGNIDDDLRRILVRRAKVRGPWAMKTWVGYRVRVLQRTWPSDDYHVVWKSNVRKKLASRTDPAVYAWRRWTAPDDLLSSDFRVVIDVIHYRKGSKWRKRGLVRGVMEVHRHAHPTAPSFLVGKPGDGGECYYNFWT